MFMESEASFIIWEEYIQSSRINSWFNEDHPTKVYQKIRLKNIWKESFQFSVKAKEISFLRLISEIFSSDNFFISAKIYCISSVDLIRILTKLSTSLVYNIRIKFARLFPSLLVLKISINWENWSPLAVGLFKIQIFLQLFTSTRKN